MKLFLAEPFASLWRDKDPFEEAFAIDGETYRDMGDRHTSRFESEGKAYFVKTHSGVGWQEIIKNLLCGRLPVLGAGNEWHAIERLHSLGVETMTAAAFGQQGWNPAAQRSFLVTEALEPAEELDSYCTPAVLSAMGPRERRALVKKLAAISRALHDHGINHRDYYLCHFLLDTAAQYAETPISQRPIYLIDLHRVQIRKRTPRRWRKKDLAGLYYSARRAGFDHRDMLCFLRYYKQQPLRQVMSEGRKLWRAIAREADHLHAKRYPQGVPRLSRHKWVLDQAFASDDITSSFGSLDTVFELTGEQITRDAISDVIKVLIADKYYYVKRYARKGNGLGQWLGRSKIRGEWQNLLFFQKLGLPVPPIVAYGAKGQRGALITQEVPDTTDLSLLAMRQDPCLKDSQWVKCVSVQVAKAARTIHRQGFVHNDFKWRNILVNAGANPEICLIDCPSGGFWWGPFLQYRIIKDLACLDKVAKHHLTRRQRLFFYYSYTGKTKLTAADKKRVGKIEHFFKGRE